jgi:hypothetical protein
MRFAGSTKPAAQHEAIEPPAAASMPSVKEPSLPLPAEPAASAADGWDDGDGWEAEEDPAELAARQRLSRGPASSAVRLP